VSLSFVSHQTPSRVGTSVVRLEKIWGTFSSFFSRMLVLSRCHATTMRTFYSINPFATSHSHVTVPLFHRLMPPEGQSILWRCCYFTSGNELAWEDKAVLSEAVNNTSTQEMTGRGGDRRCDSGDKTWGWHFLVPVVVICFGHFC
jgi:hypothetical protein